MMEYLTIKNCKKSFGDLEVLKDISLSVNQGEVVSIIGPSGSGKTTLLRCATLLETMDGGTLSYLGENVCTDDGGGSKYVDKKGLAKIHRHFSLVFQNFNLFPHMSVLDNIIEAPIHTLGKKYEDAVEEAMVLLARLGLDSKADFYPQQLSGGQQQRVSIARALAMKPDILFFDEPTSALDPELTQEVLKVIKGLAADKMTMIIVTHEMQFAREVSDRIVFIEHGIIRQQGTPDELFNNPDERVKEFMGKLSS